MDNETVTKSRFTPISQTARENNIPVDGTFELTPRCSLWCKFCYIHLTPEQMKPLGRERTADEWIDMGRQAAEAGSYDLLLTGGEVMVLPDFPRIYEELCNMGYRITVFSNATLIDDSIIDLFGNYPPVRFGVTVYGASEETYKKVCGCEGFNKVINNLDRLHAAVPTLPIEFKTNIVHENKHDFDALKKLADDRKFPFRVSFATYKGIRGTISEVESSRFSFKEMIEFQRDNCPELYKSLKEDMDKDVPKSGAITCDAGRSSYCITWDGKMIPCISFSSPFTFPFEKGFKAAWNELVGYRNELSIPARCLKCDNFHYCGWCPAAVQNESGTYKETPAFCGKGN